MTNEDRLFNHRLYHLVYHWAAYVATLVLLLTLGAWVAVTPASFIRDASYLRFANIAGALASWFFLLRMKTFGDEVNALMGAAAHVKPQWFLRWFLTHPRNLWFGAVVTLAILVFNLWRI